MVTRLVGALALVAVLLLLTRLGLLQEVPLRVFEAGFCNRATLDVASSPSGGHVAEATSVDCGALVPDYVDVVLRRGWGLPGLDQEKYVFSGEGPMLIRLRWLQDDLLEVGYQHPPFYTSGDEWHGVRVVFRRIG